MGTAKISEMLPYEVTSSGCWEWLGYKNKAGYGRVTVNGLRKNAHRVVYEKFRGLVPQGLELDHLCRKRDCVNPDHLEPVTRAVNTQRGLSAKLTPTDVAYIRASRESGLDLARKFSVHAVHISKIRHNKAWIPALESVPR